MRPRRLVAAAAGVALVVPAVTVVSHVADVVAGAAAGHCAPKQHAGGEWRQYGHDYANTRTQPAEKTIGPVQAATLKKAFVVSASDGGGDGDFTGTPIVADGCLFMDSTSGWVFAFNADTGQKVWGTQLDKDGSEITSSPTVTEGQVFVAVGRTGKPYVASLDETTGKVNWTTVTDTQNGADAYGSPVVFGGVLFQGISGGSAELADDTERHAFEGAYVLIETQGAHAGRIIKKVYTVQRPAQNAKQGGATVWSTPAVDPASQTLYVGTGNPFHEGDQGTKHADAILKIDFNRQSKNFGDIIGTYDGTPEEYQTYTQHSPCIDIPGNPAPYYPQGFGSCGQMDLDFGASPNLIHGPNGQLLVGAGQKSGYYHLVNARTMKGVWHTPVGPPSSVGGIVGSTAYDGKRIYGPITVGGYVWSLDAASGLPSWVEPVGDGAHWGDPVSEANGVVYTVSLTGFLDAFDASTGAPLLHEPMAADVAPGNLAASWGGVSIARNTVYAAIGMTGLPNGSIVAFRPAIGGSSTAAAPADAGGGAGMTVVSGPQAQSYGYLTPQLVVNQGGSLQYANFDIVRHDVVQDVNADHLAYKGPRNKQPAWCSQFKKKQCPLFYSKLEGLGQTEQVLGIQNLKPGTYSFYCTLHPGMKGKLTVL